MILFKKIRWRNFLSTGNVFTELDLNSTKTTLIVGENGAGKSTLLDALSFVLFNKPFRKVNKPQLMNTINKRDLVVEIEFTIGKHEYRVVRGMKPNVFELHKNGILLNQDAENKDYQKILEDQILKINHKSFCQVVVLGSASFVPFMQLPAGQRREVIEDLLDLQNKRDLVVEIEFTIGKHEYRVVRGMKPNVFELHKNGILLNQDAENKDYQKILEDQILKINHKSFCQVVVLGSASFVPFMQLPAGQRREVIEDLLDLQIFTTMNTLLKDKLAANVAKLTELDGKTQVLEERIKQMKIRRSEIEQANNKMLEEKQAKIEECKSRIAEIDAEIESIKVDGKRLSVMIEDKDKVKEKREKLIALRAQIESRMRSFQKTIDFFHDTETCPTCNQGIDHDFKETTVTNKKNQLQELIEGISKLEDEKSKVEARMSQIMKIVDDISDLNVKWSTFKHERELQEKILGDLQKETEVVVFTDNIEESEVELDKAIDDYNTEVDERAVLTAASSILKDGGIKAKIVKQYVPIINKLINKYLSAMDFFVAFELNEQFEETIKSRFRDEFSYASFSEGEKMRINLAILFTWRAVAKMRNSINTNLLIMDEVFDSSLDSGGTEEFMKILTNLTQDTNTFIISHKGDQLFDKFERVIKFEKHKNFSRIAS